MQVSGPKEKRREQEKARREVRLPIRLTHAEAAAITEAAQAAGATNSEYVRARALQHPPRHNARAQGERRALILALGNLGAVATELHKITRHLTGCGSGAADLQPLYRTLVEIAEMGTALRNILIHGDHWQDEDER